MKKIFFTLVIFFVFVSNSFASHVMGGDITYTCLGGNQYQVTLTLYRDCAGITIGTTPQSVNFTSSCGTFDASLDWVSTTDVSQVCPTQATTCNGGTIPGTEQYIFTGVVTLPPCADWIMNWDVCCRNDGITNITTPGSQDLYVQSTLNNIAGGCNNSPQFLALPTPYLCPNQLSIYNHGASDIDGDSLYYQFTSALGGTAPPGNPLTYTGGYSPNNPIITTGGMNLNPNTGEMCFTPSQTQICVVSVIIYEYRNNILIGTQIREMQVVVSNSCSNTAPYAGSAPNCGNTGGLVITQAGPSVVQDDDNSLSMCPNDSLCFTISFLDPDGNNVTVNSNIASAIPGASFTITNNGSTNPIGNFCWVPTPLDTGINVLTVNLVDDACPISASQYYTYDITVFDQPYAGLDQTICGPQWADLQASNGAGYTWSVISGEAMNPGVNITCISCSNPSVKPNITTTYLLTSTLTSACINTDTVTVNVVPDYTLTHFGDTTLCDYLSTPIGVTVTPNAGTYTVNWTNATTLSNGTNLTPNASPTASTTYVATVTSPFGCIKTDSVTINVNPPPTLTLSPGDTSVCLGNSLNFAIESTCMYTLEMSDPGFGDGWNGQTISVYDNGVFVGTYTVLSTDNNGEWNTVTFPITNGNTITLVYGTGSFQSESAFNLIDGQGNIQFSVPQGGMTGWVDGNTYYTGVGNCGPTLSNYSFSWSPAAGLSATNIQNPVATPVTTTTYTVTLTDVGGCTVNRSQTITVVPNYTLTTTQSDSTVCLGETVNFTTTTNPAGAFNYSWTPAGIMNNASIPNPTATFTTPGLNTIILNVDNGGGCIKSDTMYVTASPTYAPNIDILNNDTTFGCGGLESMQIDLDLGAEPTCDYTLEMFDSFGDGWNGQSISVYDNGVLVGTYTVGTNDNNGDFNTVVFPVTNGGTITLVYGTGSWQSESSFNLIDGTGATQFSVAEGDMSGWVDGNTYFTGTANCGPTLSNFTYNWTPATGVSNPTIQNPILSPTSTTTYTVTVTDPVGGCFDTDSVTITINSQLSATFETVQATCNTSNDGMLIATGISPNGPFVYEFYDSTGTNLIQTNTTLTSDTLFNISSGAYLVTITDGNGCEVDTLVNVQPATEILITNVSSDTTICINNSTTLNFGAVGGTGPLTYIWDNGLIGGGPHVVTPLSNTTYTVFAQDVNGCTSPTASINVVVNPNATIALTSAIPTASQTVCINTVINPIEYTIGGGGTGTTVTGLPNGVSGNFLAGVMSITGTPSDTGTFNYLVTTIGSCSQVVDSGSITITPDATLTLTSGNQLQTVCINSPIANITYTVGGGGTNASVTGLPSGLTSSYNAGVFTISGTPTSIGTFNYTVTTSGSCLQTSLNGIIILNDSLHITTLNLSRDSICPNDTTSISINPATGGSGIGYTYNWFDNNNNPVGTGLNITVSPSSSPTTYTVVVGDNCTTPTVTRSVTVYWLPLPQPSFIANNTSGCYPILTLFTNTTPNSTNINNVTWNFGDGGISNDILNTSHLYNTPGCYDVTLTVTSIDGCVRDTSIQDFACAYDYPTADFMMNPQPTDITNPYINFTNQSMGNTNNYWLFTSGIPNASFETDPQAEFPADTAGTYLVELAVSNSRGCTDTIQKEVVINGLYLFYVPNTFTPNGDGNNDYFIPTGDGVDWTKYNLMIFDRWGEKLFETNDIMQGWDGTFNGTPVQTGVYVWKVKAKEFYRNIKTEHSGHVNLLR